MSVTLRPKAPYHSMYFGNCALGWPWLTLSYRRVSDLATFCTSKFFSPVSVISITLQDDNRSGEFWFPGDLALDLLSEFHGPGNLRKNLGRPTSASHDDRSVTQEPSQRRLLDGDTFDSWQEKFDGPPIC